MKPYTQIRGRRREREAVYSKIVRTRNFFSLDKIAVSAGLTDWIDPGRVAAGQQASLEMDSGFKKPDLLLPPEVILRNIQAMQVLQNLPISDEPKQTKVSPVNLDVAMETGTGKPTATSRPSSS